MGSSQRVPMPMVRMGDVEKAGISYSFHSDMPMAPGQPLLLMWSGVNRVTNDGNVRGPEQRVSRLGALKAVTLEAAYSLQLEAEVGSIEPGKLANFTILEENPVTFDAMKIKDIRSMGHSPRRATPASAIRPGLHYCERFAPGNASRRMNTAAAHKLLSSSPNSTS